MRRSPNCPRGGMYTKIEAAKIATTGGTHMLIASGKIEHPLQAIADGGRCTWFLTPGQSRDRAQALDCGLAGAKGHAHHRCRRGRGATGRGKACCPPA